MIVQTAGMRRALDAWCAVRVALAFSSSAPYVGAAEALTTELVVNAPSDCITSEGLLASVNALLDTPASLRGVSVQITRNAASWQARLRTPEGERSIEGESCQALGDAVAAVLALAAAPAAADDAPAAVDDAPVDGAPGDAARQVGAEAGLPPVSEGGLVMSLRASVMAEVGMLPGPSLGPRLVLGLGQGRSSVELGASALLARSAARRGARAPSGDIHWIGGHVAACRELRMPLSTCVGGELGQLVGTGAGVDEPLTARGTWLAGVVGAAWREPFRSPDDPLCWEIAIGAAFALVRPEFGFDGIGVLHRPSAVSGRLSIGLGWR